MNGFLNQAIVSFAKLLGQDGIFITFTLTALMCFVINLLLACFLRDYGFKKRLWQTFAHLFLVAVCFGVCIASGDGIAIPFLVLGVCFLTAIPVFMVRVKTFKVTEKQKNLVKFIDQEIKFATDNQTEPDNQLDFSEKPSQKEKLVSDFELDFQHVKSVINRLDYFGLKESDKKQVKELESALLLAEKGYFGQETKEKINDGLGALLKIMSKYGV